jgi:hypothetical protein
MAQGCVEALHFLKVLQVPPPAAYGGVNEVMSAESRVKALQMPLTPGVKTPV